MVEDGLQQKAGRLPRVTVRLDDGLMIALKLARAGYGGGDPMRIMEWPADIVVAALQYEKFRGDYEQAYLNLNYPGDK